ncbi:PRC-barrel domain-containing protein [Catalinimonas niigatensis]|uniref:PRC-barrel domain-containing protein n=1 Tax=Catalinimonas niigatensis TaxID=1397264 RepID=UPI002665FC00|nr:PRC-barrel domain-containing protein [Catalinimonas niigatensis]WPP48993.1 PRC-barrel domain-containing protein [Catalinimonas niigatensis]
MTESNYQLRKLSNLKDYRVTKEDPDVRGWFVVGADRQRLGKVNDLILDPEARKVRYLEVKLESELLAGKETRHILIPIGKARIDRDDDMVLIDSLDVNKARFYPVYSGEAITRDYEHSLREALHEETHQHTHDTHTHAEQGVQDEEPLHKMQRERDIARSERDILRSEVEMLKAQLRKARNVLDDSFYDHESFDERQFYENRSLQHTHREESRNL